MSPVENDPNGYPFDGGKDWEEWFDWSIGGGWPQEKPPPFDADDEDKESDVPEST